MGKIRYLKFNFSFNWKWDFFICRMPTTNVLSPLWFYTTPRITNKGNQTQTKKKINCLFFKFWFLVKRETIDDGTYSSMYTCNEKIRIWSYLPEIVHSDFCLIAAIGQNNHLPAAEQPNSEIDDDDAKGKWPYLLLRSRHYYYVYTRLFFLLFFFSYGLLIFFFCISLIPRSLKKNLRKKSWIRNL